MTGTGLRYRGGDGIGVFAGADGGLGGIGRGSGVFGAEMFDSDGTVGSALLFFIVSPRANTGRVHRLVAAA
jgi:hypothetical protein